jgi:hypothetical protein
MASDSLKDLGFENGSQEEMMEDLFPGSRWIPGLQAQERRSSRQALDPVSPAWGMIQRILLHSRSALEWVLMEFRTLIQMTAAGANEGEC